MGTHLFGSPTFSRLKFFNGSGMDLAYKRLMQQNYFRYWTKFKVKIIEEWFSKVYCVLYKTILLHC